MIELVTGWFYEDEHSSVGNKKFMVSHGVDWNTGKTVILPNEHPRDLGGFEIKPYGWFIRK